MLAIKLLSFSLFLEIMNQTDTANVLPHGMGCAGFWRYENDFHSVIDSSFPCGRAPGFALAAG